MEVKSIEVKRTSFINSIKIEKDSDIEFLKSIQSEIEKGKVNKEEIIELIKDLSREQKDKLQSLYDKDINKLKGEIEICKKKILKLKNQL